jgi:hypothetical protein
VIATGYAQHPWVPRLAARLDPAIAQLVPTTYRRPSQLDAGGVLVVGASASGLQLADELSRAGRDVTIAVGPPHAPAPRLSRRGHLCGGSIAWGSSTRPSARCTTSRSRVISLRCNWWGIPIA